jgi:tetratricopeptide (TPR) repeat protein
MIGSRIIGRKKLRDVDSAEIAFRIRIALYSRYGAVFGAMAGGFKFGPVGMIVGAVMGWALVYYGTLMFVTTLGTIGSRIYHPTARSTPAPEEYSFVQSLVEAGKLHEAAATYQQIALQNPRDPEPKLRLARLLRDELQRLTDAAEWFKRVLAINTLPAATYELASRELIELYTHKLHDSPKALPYLAKLISKYPESASTEWAKQEMADIKSAMLRASQ